MKHVQKSALLLLLCATFGFAQNKDQKPQTGQPAQAAGTQAPAGKRPAQAKTKEEYKAYTDLLAIQDPAAKEKAADAFVAKYPDSELKDAAYQQVMAAYQSAGNEEKTLEMGRKALTFNPDNPGVLVTVADLIAQRTRETDLDKDERLGEATKDAQRALEVITDYPAPQGMPAEQASAIKNEMRAAAYGVLGMAAFTNKKYPDAETNFRKALEFEGTNPDPTLYLRLTLTLDHENKYAEALEMANKTLSLVPADSPVAAYANQEKARLTKLVSAPPKPAQPAAVPTSPQPSSSPVKP